MKILICNVGSTSLKYQLFDMEKSEAVLASGGAERVGTDKSEFYWKNAINSENNREINPFPSHKEAISRMLDALLDGVIDALSDVDAVGFKVVLAKGVTGVEYLTEEVLSAMADFNCVAPAHNPPYISAIRQFRELMPETPMIGSFETAFHKDMPPEAYLYPIPAKYAEMGIRRYGFHGASLEYLSTWTAKTMGRDDLKLVCCHLGGSGSLCAVKNGVSVDTTLGMGLQCGVMHNNRAGDMDPYIIFYLVEELGMSLDEVKAMLQKDSGFLGMSGGVSGDLRDVEEMAKKGDINCQNTVKSYAYSIKKYIGSYMAAMGGLDAIVFGGGIGRNGKNLRAAALDDLKCFGVEVDPVKNDENVGGSNIGTVNSIPIFVVDTNEEIIVARKAKQLLESN
ncbi:MAG: acetate/propionate family kinase [Eubacteriales bacterium]